MASRRRLDLELVRRELAPSREVARRLIEEGAVLVSGSVATKVARLVDPGEPVVVTTPPRYVGRGGLKLEAQCTDMGGLQVRANPAGPNSEANSQMGDTPDDFDPGDNALVVNEPGDAAGTIAYTGATGRVVTLQVMTRQDPDGVRGTTNDCGFSGIAYSG